MTRCGVVVLAGGASSRFGADKLDADVRGLGLLDRVVRSLPADLEVVVVGPERALGRTVRFVREDPPGGGPGAALVAGLSNVSDSHVVLVVPGDAPDSGPAATVLLAELMRQEAVAVIGVDPNGQDQPLQLALIPDAVRRVIALAGPTRGAGASVRQLIGQLGTDLVRVPITAAASFDVDTREQLDRYLRSSPV